MIGKSSTISLSSSVFLLGFFFLAFDSILYDIIVAFASDLSAFVFFWPSEFILIFYSWFVFLYIKPTILIPKVYRPSFWLLFGVLIFFSFYGIFKGNSFVVDVLREFVFPSLCFFPLASLAFKFSIVSYFAFFRISFLVKRSEK